MSKPLTDRQQEVLKYLREYHRDYDCLPTTQNVADYLGVWNTAAMGHLNALVKKGKLERLAIKDGPTFRFPRK